jgi:protein phosphatase
MQYEINIGVGQSQGQRSYQEDYFATSNIDNAAQEGFLAIIADGMGGHADGDKASILATNDFIREYQRKRQDNNSILDSLESALHEANYKVVQHNQKHASNMGTTLVACILQDEYLHWVSVGDSCLFYYHNDELEKLNVEHSYGQILDKQVEIGEISQQEANEQCKKRNMLTSYLGREELYERDLKQISGLSEGQKILLCSDGLVNALTEYEIIACLQSKGSTQQKCDLLIRSALDKNLKSQDNITVILIELTLDSNITITRSVPNKKPIFITILAMTLILLIVMLLWLSAEMWSQPKITSQNPPPQQPTQPTQQVTVVAEKTETQQVKPEMTPNEEENEKESELKDEVVDSCSSLTIKEIQNYLQYLKLYNDKIDGDNGKNTQLAIQAFKKRYDIQPADNSDLTKKTCDKLQEQYEEFYSNQQTEFDKQRINEKLRRQEEK